MNNGESPTSVILYKEVYGSGDPILCLHGMGASVFTWRHFIAPFSQTNQLITVDFRGCGKSPKPNDTHYSIEEHAADIYNIIINENLTKLTLVGNSLGGAVALLVAIRLIEEDSTRLSRLVLVDSGGDKNLPFHLKLLRSILGGPMVYLAPVRFAAWVVLKVCYYDKRKTTQEQVAAYADAIGGPGGRHALLQTARQCIPKNFDEILAKLKNITVPTYILWGREDRITPLTIGEKLHQAIPNSTLDIIEHCGHIPQEEKPDETIARLAKFFATT